MTIGLLSSLLCLGAGIDLTHDTMYEIEIKQDIKLHGYRAWLGTVRTWTDYS